MLNEVGVKEWYRRANIYSDLLYQQQKISAYILIYWISFQEKNNNGGDFRGSGTVRVGESSF